MKNWRSFIFREKIKNLTKRKYKIEECETSEKDCISGATGVFTAAMLILFMVATIVFALYEFVHISGISKLAGIHVTAPLKNVADEMINGKIETIPGYERWLRYHDDVFEFRYPNDWTVQKSDDGKNTVSLKKYNATRQGSDSLAATVFMGFSDVPDDLSMKDILEKRGIVWNEEWKQEMFGDKPGIRTGEIKMESGIIRDSIFWKFNSKLYSIEIDYLSDKIEADRTTFEKIIAQFKFI